MISFFKDISTSTVSPIEDVAIFENVECAKFHYKDGQEYEGGHPKYYQTFDDALLNRNPIDG